MDIPKGSMEADLAYKEVNGQKIYLTFLPPLIRTLDKAPVYVVICGGGWHDESRAKMLTSAAISIERLRNQGFAAVSIDYRTYAEGNGVYMEQIISDCFDSLRYLAHFADILQIDPHRIATCGHSAGGHLALMIAYAPNHVFCKDSILNDDFTVTVTAPLSPLTVTHGDFTSYTQCDMPRLYAPGSTEEDRRKTSPITYVSSSSPATILAAGTADELIYDRSSRELYAALQAANVPSELLLSTNGGHCFEEVHPGMTPSVSKQEVHKQIAEFILQHI